MPLMISTVDQTLMIPPFMRGIFPNKEKLVIELKAEVPKEVPQYVLDYYIKNRPRVYRKADQPKPEPEKIEDPGFEKPPKFDAVSWLEINYSRIEDAIPQLETKEKFAVAKALKLRVAANTGDERLTERIIQDVKVKEQHQKDLEEHKGVTTQ